ncbi:MAG: hypothetical protein JST39_05720 [Bacteroidetes bacterium]|nr:hypothetical protein [Bacteroidota bacterium]
MLKSRFSFSHFYLPLGIFTLCYLFPAGFYIWPDLLDFSKRLPEGDLIFSITGIVFIGIAGVVYLARKAPVIRISQEDLIIHYLHNKRKIPYNEVNKIELISSARSGFLFFTQDSREATIVETISGERIPLFVSFYENMPEIRRALHSWMGLSGAEEQQASSEAVPKKEVRVPGGGTQRFAGPFLRLFTGIAFYEVLVLLVVIPLMLLHFDSIGLVAALIFVWMFVKLFAGQAYYFVVSGEQLLIKNLLYPWYKESILLKEIRDVKFESIQKRGNVLRVVTWDFESYRFAAILLRERTWKALEEALTQNSIPVRNEIVP